MFVPPQVVTNKDLEAQMDTTDEWIQKRTGIRERRYAAAGLGAADLGVEASQRALEAAGIKGSDLDLILVATLTPDYFFPGTAFFIQDKLGLGTKPAMDIRCQCSGFLYALSVGQLFVASGQYERVLVCGTEVHSRGLNMTTQGRGVSVLFGDGAGAVVLTAAERPGQGILSVRLHADGAGRDMLKMEYPGFKNLPYLSAELLAEGKHWPEMDGRQVFKNAVRRMPEVVMEVLEEQNLVPDDVDFFLFHQANLRINEAVLAHLNQPASKTYNNIDRYGNCSAASIPMAMDEAYRSGRIKSGDLVCLAGFGAGFTWAGALIRW
jgi:3-oxoacyl-[acyl-carrier-protein] synthase-3